MPDLHSRIASELSRRLEVAKAAAPPWGRVGESWTADGRQVMAGQVLLVQPNTWFVPEAVAAHVALHDPADAERRYSSALRVLERHRPMTERRWVGVGTLISRDPEVRSEDGYATETECAGCDIWTNDGGGYLLFVECEEIRDLAASLGLDTEGSTTDG